MDSKNEYNTDCDLRFQGEIHRNLFQQFKKTMELLLTKYTRTIISYEGISCVETYEYPKDALREALLNAVSHKDYANGYPLDLRSFNS